MLVLHYSCNCKKMKLSTSEPWCCRLHESSRVWIIRFVHPSILALDGTRVFRSIVRHKYELSESARKGPTTQKLCTCHPTACYVGVQPKTFQEWTSTPAELSTPDYIQQTLIVARSHSSLSPSPSEVCQECLQKEAWIFGHEKFSVTCGARRFQDM